MIDPMRHPNRCVHGCIGRTRTEPDRKPARRREGQSVTHRGEARAAGDYAADRTRITSARPGCIPAITTERGPTQSLPATQAQPSLTPEEINPGLAPGIDASPQDVPTSPSAGNKVRGKISSD